jgi:hypothetical protein
VSFVTAAKTQRVGATHEWHLVIRKSLVRNDIGEKGLACLDGFDNESIFGKEAQRCVFLIMESFANK